MPNTTTRRRFALNAPQQLISAGINSAVTSLQVPSFSGWPTQFPFYGALELGTASLEIVSVTNIVGTTATIVRAQRGTAAIAHPLGATFDMVAVDQDYDEANLHSSSTSGLHGVAGNVVGDTDIQTMTNKTLDKAKFTGDAGTEAIQSKATAVGGKVFSGRDSTATEQSNILDTGAATFKGGLTIGTSGQLTVSNAGALSTSGSLTTTGTGALTVAGAANFNGAGTGLAVANNATVGGTLTVTSAISGSSVAGIVVPKSFTNQAAAGTATAGYIVYLTTPTGGFAAGLFRGNGSIWLPVTGTVGGRARTNVAQAITASVNTALTNNGTAAWTAVEDFGGFVSATGGTTTPIIIPTGMGGRYIVGLATTMSAIATTRGFAEIRLNGAAATTTGRSVFTSDTNTVYSVPLSLSAGDTLGANISNNATANASIGCEIFAFRIGD